MRKYAYVALTLLWVSGPVACSTAKKQSPDSSTAAMSAKPTAQSSATPTVAETKKKTKKAKKVQ
ncbi:MAG TPA: hypothetical protein VHE12_08485 [bacterium]|nr:hypothetical protein [bacterium]